MRSLKRPRRLLRADSLGANTNRRASLGRFKKVNGFRAWDWSVSAFYKHGFRAVHGDCAHPQARIPFLSCTDSVQFVFFFQSCRGLCSDR